MKVFSALLRIAVLAPFLPAFLAQEDDQPELHHTVVTETTEEGKHTKTSTFAFVPLDSTTLNAATSKTTLDVAGPCHAPPPSQSFPKKPFLITKRFRLFCAFAFILSILILARQRQLVFPPLSRTPAELSLDLKNAFSLLIDAEDLANAVATKEVSAAHGRAAEFLSEAQAAFTLADTKVGLARERALMHMKNKLNGAVEAFRDLHEATKQAGVKALEDFSFFPPVAQWCESMGRIVGDNNHFMAAAIALISSETSAGVISARGRVACQRLASQAFGSLADGEVLREALRNFLALQEASEEVYAFSEWAEEVQNNILKALVDEEKIKRVTAAQRLVEDLDLAQEACTYFLKKVLQELPADADNSKCEAEGLECYEFMQRARKNFATFFDAHSKIIVSMTSSIDPEEYLKLHFEAKLLESSMKALVNTLWGYADSYGSDIKYSESKEWFERRKVLMECRALAEKVEVYRQLTAEKICGAREALRKLFSFGQANASGYFLTPKLTERVLALFNQSELIAAQEQKLTALLSAMKQGKNGLIPLPDAIMERNKEDIAEVENEARKMIGMCQEVSKLHMEVMLLINLQKLMSASIHTVERLRPLIPEGPGEAAETAQELLEKFYKAKKKAQSRTELMVVAEAAATIGLTAAELGNLVFENE